MVYLCADKIAFILIRYLSLKEQNLLPSMLLGVIKVFLKSEKSAILESFITEFGYIRHIEYQAFLHFLMIFSICIKCPMPHFGQ